MSVVSGHLDIYHSIIMSMSSEHLKFTSRFKLTCSPDKGEQLLAYRKSFASNSIT